MCDTLHCWMSTSLDWMRSGVDCGWVYSITQSVENLFQCRLLCWFSLPLFLLRCDDGQTFHRCLRREKGCRRLLADSLVGKTKQLVPLLGNWTLEKSGSIGRLDVN